MFLKRALFANLAIHGANAYIPTIDQTNHSLTASDVHDSKVYTLGKYGKWMKTNSSEYMWIGLDMTQNTYDNHWCIAFETSVMSDEYHFGVS